MFEPDAARFLESGCALIVGTVDEDNHPRAARGWGLDVLSGERDRIRLLLDADDTDSIEHLAATSSLAVTATNVHTLHSMQLKGWPLAVEAATDDDRARAARYCNDFFSDVVDSDGTDRALLERLVPRDYLACTIEVDQQFDQTPGPRAGAPMGFDRR